MSLSNNIKRLRLERNLTQEQLATKLGVSAQAVSKWETSETYPDGALLVPLSKELGVSLDELFDNDPVSMADISARIMSIIDHTEEKERFNVARDICWQIERGLFDCRMKLDEKYDPNDIKNRKSSSYILFDNGFTVVSNGKEPFFALFPQPKEGYGHFLNNKDELRNIFDALSDADIMTAIDYLYRRNEDYVFESAVLAAESDMSPDRAEEVLEKLILLNAVNKHELTVNGEKRTLYYSKPDHKLLALLIMANELGYKGAHTLTAHVRKTPFFKQ